MKQAKMESESFHLMTEESGGESAEDITCHPLPWISESMCKLVHTQYANALCHNSAHFPCRCNKSLTSATRTSSKRGSTNMQGEHRIQGSASALPRLSGPQWALKAPHLLRSQHLQVTSQYLPVASQAAPLTSENSNSDIDSDLVVLFF